MTEIANLPPAGQNIVITYPFPLGFVDGGARMTREIARHLGKLGANVSIVSISRGAGPRQRFPRSKAEDEFLGREFDRELAEDGVKIFRVSQHPLHWRLDSLSVKKALGEILHNENIDLVLSYFNDGTCLPSFLHSRNVKFGYIATWQSYEAALHASRGIQGLLKQGLDHHDIVKPHRQADIIYATSRFTRDELTECMGIDQSRIRVCYLGVDPGFAAIARSAPAQVNRFIFIGRIRASKGILDALAALGKLAAVGLTDWNFRMIGGAGEYGMGLARDAALRYGISTKVEFCGELDDDGLRHELREAHVGIMPSHAESFGLAIAETQAAGVPVIAYDTTAVPEVVEHGVTGWLAPMGNVDALANYVEMAIKDPAATHQKGQAARKRMQQNFTWPATARRILEGLESI